MRDYLRDPIDAARCGTVDQVMFKMDPDYLAEWPEGARQWAADLVREYHGSKPRYAKATEKTE